MSERVRVPGESHGARSRLTESEVKALIAASFDRVVVFDGDGRYICVPVGKDRLHRPYEEVIGRKITEIMPEPNGSIFLSVIRKALSSGETQRLDYQLALDGKPTWLSGSIAPTGDGTVIWVARDVSAQRRAEDALRSSEAAHRELLAALPVIVYWVSPEPPFSPQYVSPGIETLGYSLREWLDRPDMWLSVLHPEDRDRVLLETERALATEPSIEYEYRVIASDGRVRWMHDRGEFLRDHRGRVTSWRGVMIDVTERRELQERLWVLSEQDELTDLLNRRGFRRMAEQALKVEHRAGRRVAVLYFDLADFKSINDSHGHAVGDRALRAVADGLRGGAREGDLVARLGGDEFVVFAVGLRDAADAESLARRLGSRVTESGEAAGIPQPLALTFGVCESAPDRTLDELLGSADGDLYVRRGQAEHRGRC